MVMGLTLLACAPPTATEVYAVAWSELDRSYALFGVKDIDWDLVREAEALAPEAADDRLYAALQRMLVPLNDNHVQLLAPGQNPWTPGTLQGAVRDGFAPDVVRSYLTDAAQPHPRVQTGWLGNDVAYAWVGRLDRQTVAHVEAFLDDMGDADVVLDLRDNQGGYHLDLERVAARFAPAGPCRYTELRRRTGPQRDAFGPWIRFALEGQGRFEGRLLVLQDGFTISGGENLLLALRCVPGVRTFGASTAGAMGARLWKDLPNGWVVSSTVEDVRDEDGVSYEGRGLAPDVAVFASLDDLAAARDPVLEAALEELGR